MTVTANERVMDIMKYLNKILSSNLQKWVGVVAAFFLMFGSQSIEAHQYVAAKSLWQLPNGLQQVGDGHGEIVVSSNGEIYLSVQGGLNNGIQVYDLKGKYLRNVPNAPTDLHGFTIRQEGGQEFIYGARMVHGSVVKMTLTGKIVMEIPKESIPEKFRKIEQPQQLKLTAVAVAPSGDIYTVDGYGLDWIHQFDKVGKYLKTFGGRNAPYHFSNCHKIAIDPRYDPVRILCTNRARGTLVHLALDGSVIGVHAKGLRRPSAVAFRDDALVVAEIVGRISILDKHGKITTVVSENSAKYKGNRWTPEEWKNGIVCSPHGIAFDSKGNILMTEYNKFGRIMRFDLIGAK
jgi:hypothetical protein